MSNLADIISYFASLGDQCPPVDAVKNVVAPLVASAQVQHDTPDSNGLVALLGLPEGSAYANYRFAIKEIGLALDAVKDPRAGFVLANVGFADTLQVIEGDLAFIPACHPLVPLSNPPQIDNRATALSATQAVPSHDRNGNPKMATVADTVKHYAGLPNPVTNVPFPHV